MNITPNYGLGQPLPTEKYDISVINANSGIIDTALAAKQDKLVAGTNIFINGKTISATNTTYSNLTPKEDSSEVSLVTRGEKYEWEHKPDSKDFSEVAFSGDYNDLKNAPSGVADALTPEQLAALIRLL